MYFIVKNQCEQAAAKLLEVCFFKHDRWVGSLREKTIFFLCLRWHVKKGGVTSRLHQITYIYIYLYISLVFFLTVHHKSDRQGFGFEKQRQKPQQKPWGESIFFSSPQKKTGCLFCTPKVPNLFGVCQNLPRILKLMKTRLGFWGRFFFVKVNRLGFLLEKSGKTNSAGDKA